MRWIARCCVVVGLVAVGPAIAQQQEEDVFAVNARAHANAVKSAYYRLEDFILRRATVATSWGGEVPPVETGLPPVETGWEASWTERGVRARYCADPPAIPGDPQPPGVLAVYMGPRLLMGVGADHRSVHAAPRLYGRERRKLQWLEAGEVRGGDGRDDLTLPVCMRNLVPSGRAALAGVVVDPWTVTRSRSRWENRPAVCPSGFHRPPGLPVGEASRTERRSVTVELDKGGQVFGSPVEGSWAIASDRCVADYTVSETEQRACTYQINGNDRTGYEIWTRGKTVAGVGDGVSDAPVVSGNWSKSFSTCENIVLSAVTPLSGTPEETPDATITFPTWEERQDGLTCPVCTVGSAYRWRRHTDRHVQFSWDSEPTVQTDWTVTNWIRVESGCSAVPATVVGDVSQNATRNVDCPAGYTGLVVESRDETYRREQPCGGVERSVLVSATDWRVTSRSCVREGDPDDPLLNDGVCRNNSGSWISDPDANPQRETVVESRTSLRNREPPLPPDWVTEERSVNYWYMARSADTNCKGTSRSWGCWGPEGSGGGRCWDDNQR